MGSVAVESISSAQLGDWDLREVSFSFLSRRSLASLSSFRAWMVSLVWSSSPSFSSSTLL